MAKKIIEAALTDLGRLAQAVADEFPMADLRMDEPERPGQAGWLDITHDGLWIAVEWRPGSGFGVSTNEPAPKDPAQDLFAGPDTIFADWGDAKEHVLSWLRSPVIRVAGKRASR